jgi:hypothetical protein
MYDFTGQGKSTAPISTNINVLSAFCRSPPAGSTQNVTLGRKAESPLRKAEIRAVGLPGP